MTYQPGQGAPFIAPHCRGELPHDPHDPHWWMGRFCDCPCHGYVNGVLDGST